MVLLGTLFLSRLVTIYEDREHSYILSRLYYSVEEMNAMEISFAKYDNSMNFVFGLTGIKDEKLEDGAAFDILNNPYVEFLGYELYTPAKGEKQQMREKYEIGKCTEDHKARFMPPHTRGWYD